MRPVIAYASPFVPPEWIAAFGLTPRRLIPGRALTSGREGACPWAAALSIELARGDVAGAITVTTCDQLRRHAEGIDRAPASLMLMNVPATWQGSSPRQLYRSELERMGRFLETLGGTWPSGHTLSAELHRFHSFRSRLRSMSGLMPASRWQEALQAGPASPLPVRTHTADGVPIAVLGGPLCREDRWVLDLIEHLGGHIALDASETGERSLPSPCDTSLMVTDPLEAIVHAYFDGILDAFRRPDSRLYVYLAREITARGIRGIFLLRYPWCDQWHAQLARLKERLAVPVVEIDLCGSDQTGRQRITTRLETLIRIVA